MWISVASAVTNALHVTAVVLGVVAMAIPQWFVFRVLGNQVYSVGLFLTCNNHLSDTCVYPFDENSPQWKQSALALGLVGLALSVTAFLLSLRNLYLTRSGTNSRLVKVLVLLFTILAVICLIISVVTFASNVDTDLDILGVSLVDVVHSSGYVVFIVTIVLHALAMFGHTYDVIVFCK